MSGAACNNGLNNDLNNNNNNDVDDVLLVLVLVLIALLLVDDFLLYPFPLTIPLEMQKDAAPTSMSPYPAISVLQNRRGKKGKSTANIATKVK